VQIRTHNFLGVIEEYDNGFAKIPIRNQFKISDEIEIITPNKIFKEKVGAILDRNKQVVEVANPGAKEHIAYVKLSREYPKYAMVRKRLK